MFLSGQWPEILRFFTEVILLWVFFYHAFKVVRGTRAMQVVKVLIFMSLMLYAAYLLGLDTIYWILSSAMPSVAIALVVLYAPELRRTVTQMAQVSLFVRSKTARNELVAELLRAARTMSGRHIGALVVFERQNSLQGFIDTGIPLDAQISAELLISIFNTKGPLHDGAVIVKDERAVAASCLLPLTQRSDADESYGTRHRAAIGLSEETDAVVLVISEETGAVSVVVNGQMTRDLDYPTLERVLTNLLGLD